MKHYILRTAGINDHEKLVEFYNTYYKMGHPLYNKAFWKWQYDNAAYGRCTIAIAPNGDIVGHQGELLAGGVVWIVNILIQKMYAGTKLVQHMFDKARERGPLAGSVVNSAGTKLMVRLQWYRHCNLQRYVLVNPKLRHRPVKNWLQPMKKALPSLPTPEGYYWQQPFLQGIQLQDGSTAVAQPHVGGLRLVHLQSPKLSVHEAWELGFGWVDYIGSWNDPVCIALEKNKWDTRSPMPWLVNPVDFSYEANLNLFSEEPLPRDFLFRRNYADIGRVGIIREV